MKTNVQILHGLVLAAFMSFGANVRAAALQIVQEPETLTIEAGTFAAFSVQVTSPQDASYQWKFNGTNIGGADKREFVIQGPTTNDVGGYSVQVTWPATNIISSTGFLSVYEKHHTNSTVGVLTTPVGLFGTLFSPSTFTCPTPTPYGGYAFNRHRNPADSAGNYFFFYGPAVPVASQGTDNPFRNDGQDPYLVISTAGGYNLPRPTGIYFFNAFYPIVTPIYCGCEAGDSNQLPSLSYYSMSTNPNHQQARYRATIYYIDPPPASGKIVMTWTYYD